VVAAETSSQRSGTLATRVSRFSIARPRGELLDYVCGGCGGGVGAPPTEGESARGAAGVVALAARGLTANRQAWSATTSSRRGGGLAAHLADGVRFLAGEAGELRVVMPAALTGSNADSRPPGRRTRAISAKLAGGHGVASQFCWAHRKPALSALLSSGHLSGSGGIRSCRPPRGPCVPRRRFRRGTRACPAGRVSCQTVRSASVGDRRAARMAGSSPARAPMTTAAARAPAQAWVGMVTVSPWPWA
jgi:hypothetical protein